MVGTRARLTAPQAPALGTEWGLPARELVAENSEGFEQAEDPSSTSQTLSLPVPSPRSGRGGERQPQAGPEAIN